MREKPSSPMDSSPVEEGLVEELREQREAYARLQLIYSRVVDDHMVQFARAQSAEAMVATLSEALEKARNGLAAAQPILSGAPRTDETGIMGRRQAVNAGFDAASSALTQARNLIGEKDG
jgi:hypothetical protein